MRTALAALFLAALLTPALASADSAIPPRPEQLAFPALNYQPPNPADYRVRLKSGPVVYIMPDHELPLVNIAVYVHVGQYLEPAGKEGLAELTGWLMAHGGAGTNTAEQLEERLAFLAANLSCYIGDTEGSVSLNLLSKDLDEGLGIMRDVLYAPRFQEDKIKLRKDQMLQEMKQRNDDSADIEGRESGFLTEGENFWENRYPTAASVDSITRDDLATFQQRWFVPQNFVVAVSGDFDRDAMIAKLETLFARPAGGEFTPPPAIPTNTVFAAPGIYVVDKPDVNQGRVSMMLPGILRNNPDYFPAIIMNDILGGGGFSARIVNRVRSDEGLAYSAGSRFPGGVYFPSVFTAAFQSKSRTVPYAISLVEDEMNKIVAQPVTAAELDASKQSFIERFPRTFATKIQSANTFAQDEFTGRYVSDPDFWKEYRSRIAAVTAADVQRVAEKYLHPDQMVILVVGNKKDILLGYPGHPVQLSDLGKLVDVPLRDPLTMQPLTNAPAQ